MMKKQLCLSILCAGLLAGCAGSASHQVVSVHEAGDDSLSCSQIDNKIVSAQTIIDDVNKDKADLSDADVVDGILWFPFNLVAKNSNYNKAISSAERRIDTLQTLKKEKHCVAESYTLDQQNSPKIERFKAAIKNMKFFWNPDATESQEEITNLLFAFMSETYGGIDAFGVPESMLVGNSITRAIWNYDEVLGRQVGLVLWPENQEVEAYGLSQAKGRYTSNCLMCHVAEIDSVVYFGAGNKTLDEKKLVDIAIRATSPAGRSMLNPSPSEQERMAQVHHTLKRQRHEKTDPLTRGLFTSFVRSHVELYRSANGGEAPPTDEIRRGDAKAPPLWHYSAKAPFQRWYLDGSVRGEYPLMASSMELPKGRSVEELVDIVIPTIVEQFESVVKNIRPPKYPYDIDRDLAEKGKSLFYSAEIGCYACHGNYDENGNVQWTGNHVNVGTDPARLNVVTDDFINVINASPMQGQFELVKSHGYPATPLTGVWANFPYLHNGSVPTLYHLLGPPSERPRIFYVFGAKRLDQKWLGQQLLPKGFNPNTSESELMKTHGSDRDWFNTNRNGHGNMGHDLWPRIQTDANRMALIEYLKTL